MGTGSLRIARVLSMPKMTTLSPTPICGRRARSIESSMCPAYRQQGLELRCSEFAHRFGHCQQARVPILKTSLYWP